MGHHQLLVYAADENPPEDNGDTHQQHKLEADGDENPPEDNGDTTQKNAESFIDDSKGVDLEINAEKTECMSLSRHHNAGQKRDIKLQTDRLKMCDSSTIWGGK
jgi:hypothetical protein